MTGDAELMTGVPRWYNFLPGLSPLAHSFTVVEAGRALGRDVYSFKLRSHCFPWRVWNRRQNGITMVHGTLSFEKGDHIANNYRVVGREVGMHFMCTAKPL